MEVDGRGALMEVLDRKPEVRRIKIKSLSADKNMAQLANDIIDKCKYIHPSRAEEIETLLIHLRRTKLAQSDSGTTPSNHCMHQPQHNSGSSYQGAAAPSSDRHREKDKESRLPSASMNQLDDYLELLYQVSGKTEKEREEGLRMQEKGTLLILRLCRDVMNLEQLIQNGTVMGAVTRVFQEEYKRSLDLSFNILRIFLAFSNFVEMHALMAQYKIGVLTMRWVDFEALRCSAMEQEAREREEALARQLEESKKIGDPQDYAKALEKVRRSREREAAKQRVFSRKQDRVFFVAFYILLNLAEDAGVEKKMLKKGLVQMLLAMLGRRYEDLLLLVLTFLKKLSVFEENKEAFKQCLLVDHVSKFLACSSQPLVLMVLRLLFNLSFDKVC
ncbi:hypothetical protein EON64_01030 [archaeon]|nr:MAG: hypothetical protein EON64_01030 [archaeon]